MHPLTGSPTQFGKQVHLGLWLMTVHSELRPHVSGQGSIHLFLEQESTLGQSESTLHSGSGGADKRCILVLLFSQSYILSWLN